MKLQKKIKLTGIIHLETGLHIGGAKTTMQIGGLDSPVIKTPNGIPYIPGSSLKGKLRTLLARKINGADEVDNDPQEIKKLFGYSGKEAGSSEISRLIIRDAYLDEKQFKDTFPFDEVELESEFTEGKYENTINRKSGKAGGGGVRQIERVPAGAKFKFEMILDVYDTDNEEEMLQLIQKGKELMEQDYLGGNGTRGYGKVKLEFDESNK